jgi:hypothetical protein
MGGLVVLDAHVVRTQNDAMAKRKPKPSKWTEYDSARVAKRISITLAPDAHEAAERLRLTRGLGLSPFLAALILEEETRLSKKTTRHEK